jgi:transposase
MEYRKPRMDSKQREDRRMEALRRLRAGESAPSVAASLGVAPNTVYTWGKLAREGGKAALKSVPKSGRPVKLAREHWTTLRRMVLRGPAACGFDRELWTLPMVKELIEREFGVSYHDDHLSKFMRGLGLSRQKPAVRARERDERAIGRFIKADFPAIEKKQEKLAPR